MSNSDLSVTLNQLKESVKRFCEERDWDQFHSPNHLAVGVVTESAELLDLFRFLSDQDSKSLVADPELKEKVEDELADVLFFFSDSHKCIRSIWHLLSKRRSTRMPTNTPLNCLEEATRNMGNYRCGCILDTRLIS